jgi:hypothetical protein
MKRRIQSVLGACDLCARAVTHTYRYCPRCRREWSAEHKSCLECLHWLGEHPLERIEWQLSSAGRDLATPATYELIGASAVVLRIVSRHLPREMLAQISGAVADIFALANDTAISRVEGHGWLVWTTDGLRRAFRQGLEIEQRLAAALPRFDAILLGANVRWGIWIDQYVLPFGRDGTPVIPEIAAGAIFNFEPDNGVLSSEAVYQTNRRWEHFVCVPRRLGDGKSGYGFRLLSHKRPSALDHAKVPDASPFLGRKRELALLDRYCRKREEATVRLALVAEAGSGKTRLMKEWLRRHSHLRAMSGSFSLFGGDTVRLASQFTDLPPDSLSDETLLASVLSTIRDQAIQVLVVDDLHFADPDGAAFVHRLLDALPPERMLVLLASRPSGRSILETLAPTAELLVDPLPAATVHALARQLIGSEDIAAIAAQRSNGNPLFVEQFAAWVAETGYDGKDDGPRSLHQVISARIAHLSQLRLSNIQQTLRWGRSWQRQAIDDELNRLEIEIGLWLDRLETGDYADQVETAQYLADLERVDYEIFIISALAGKPRPRSSRLREAIERLVIGSADQILAHLTSRASAANGAERQNISREARRGGDIAYGAFQWPLAAHFYELALGLSATEEKEELEARLVECRRRSLPALADETDITDIVGSADDLDLDIHPMVDLHRLPQVWLQLARRQSCKAYFLRAAIAADEVNDRALAMWARRKAERACNQS